MKTMNKIFRTLLMTIALVMGVVNVQAEDIWTGPEKNQGSFTVVLSDAAKQAIDTQTKIQIYCKDKNINYWSLGITVDRDKNHTASLVSNWNGEGYGSQTIGKNNLIDDECIELTLTDDGVEAIIDNGLQIIIEQNITVYKVSLVYSGDPVIPKYTLTYVVDGNTVKTERLVEGATPNPPADPTKDDYVFVQWTNLPATMPAQDVTATAEFAVRKYDVKFYIDNELVETVQYAPGETIAEKEAPDARTGYTFSGWSGYPENKVMPKWDVNISGQFNVNHHYIVYNKDGNYYDGKYNIPYGATIAPDYLPENNPTKEGYVFDHWEGLPETMPDQDLTVEAVFESASGSNYTLTYMVDGAQYGEVVELEAGATITPPADPTKEGFTFTGWDNLPATMPAENLTVNAIFTQDSSTEDEAKQYLAFKTPEYCAANWNAATNTFTWGSGGWDSAFTFMEAVGVSGDLSSWKKLHLHVSDWSNASAQTLKVVFKTDNGQWPPSGPTREFDNLSPDASGNIEINLENVDWGNCVISNIADLTIYGCARDNSSTDASVKVTEAYFVDNTTYDTYSITVNAGENGSASVDKPKQRTAADQLVTITITPNEGYELNNISAVYGNNQTITLNGSGNTRTFTMPANNVIVNADFVLSNQQPSTYTLTYMVDGAQYGEVVELEAGATITAPTAPTKDGFTFTGWDNLPETMPAENLTVNAQFTRNLTIGENETVIWDGTPAIVHGTEENLFIKNTNSWVSGTDQGGILRIYADINNPSNWKLWTGGGNWDHPTFVNVPNADLRESSTFTGYNATKVCFEFEFNDVTKQNLLNHITSDGTAMSISFWGLTIYKVTYEPPVNVPKHTLTFMMDDQQTVYQTLQVAEGAEIPTVTPPTKAGYTFSSWANMPLSGNMPASDLTLVAVFTEATYTLTFKIGDEVYGEPTQLAYGATITAPTDVPERTGYTFSGWQNVPETMPAQDLTIIGYYTKEKTYEPLSVGSWKYNTFYSTQPLYFQGSESVKAFIAIQYSATEVKLRQVIGAVAANTPLVLKGDAANASANIEVVESGESYGNNLLVGVRQSTSINSPQKYVLVEKSGTVKFADTGNHAATVPANKAYLQAPAGANARQLTIIFEGGVTAIEAISTENDDVPAVFNLSGQQVKNPGKGLYIVNGKKILIK